MSAVVRKSGKPPDKRYFFLACVVASAIGAAGGLALAQDRPPGRLDTACAAACVASGYEADYCGKVCWIPAPTLTRPDEATDWVCVASCRSKGGRLADCKSRCKLP